MGSGVTDLDKVKLDPKDEAFIKELDAAAERMRKQAIRPPKPGPFDHWFFHLTIWHWFAIAAVVVVIELIIMHLTGTWRR